MLNINKTNLNTETVYKAVSQNLPNAHRPGAFTGTLLELGSLPPVWACAQQVTELL